MRFVMGCVVVGALVGSGCASKKGVEGGGKASGGLSPYYASLFEQGRVFTYSWSFEVVSHEMPDEEGDGVEERSNEEIAAEVEAGMRRAVCTVTSVEVIADARVAYVDCVDPGADARDFPSPALSAIWVGTSKGLWLADSAPEDADEVLRLLDTPPILDAKPKARAWTEPIEGMLGPAEGRNRVEVIDGKEACHVYEDDEAYTTVQRRCFRAGQGLTTGFFGGREGPSIEDYTLDTGR